MDMNTKTIYRNTSRDYETQVTLSFSDVVQLIEHDHKHGGYRFVKLTIEELEAILRAARAERRKRTR